jgi:hypothetical protein
VKVVGAPGNDRRERAGEALADRAAGVAAKSEAAEQSGAGEPAAARVS